MQLKLETNIPQKIKIRPDNFAQTYKYNTEKTNIAKTVAAILIKPTTSKSGPPCCRMSHRAMYVWQCCHRTGICKYMQRLDSELKFIQCVIPNCFIYVFQALTHVSMRERTPVQQMRKYKTFNGDDACLNGCLLMVAKFEINAKHHLRQNQFAYATMQALHVCSFPENCVRI